MKKNIISELLELNKKGNSININNYFNGERDLLVQAKDYIKKYPNKAKEVEILVNTLRERKLNHIFLLEDALIGEQPVYVHDIIKIIKMYYLNPDEAVKLAYNLRKTKHAFDYTIKLFNERYVNAELFTPVLDNISKKMASQNINKRKNYFNADAFKITALSKDEEILEALYESKQSLFDFACDNLIDISKISKLLKLRTTKEMALRNDIILSRPFNNEEKIVQLLYKIIEEDLDIIDYYRICKLSPFYLRNIAKKHNINHKKLSTFLNGAIVGESGALITESYEINCTSIINGVTLTKEDKVYAINYLKENNIPLTKHVFNTMLRKIAKDKVKTLTLK